MYNFKSNQHKNLDAFTYMPVHIQPSLAPLLLRLLVPFKYTDRPESNG